MAKRISEDQIVLAISELLVMTLEQLLEFVVRLDISVLQKSLAKSILKAVEEGEFREVDKLLDRVIGKPNILGKAAKTGKDDLKKRLSGVSRERLLQIVKDDESPRADG